MSGLHSIDDDRLTSPSVIVIGIITLSTLMAHPLRTLPASVFVTLLPSRPSRRVTVHSEPPCSKVSPTHISSSSSESILSNEEDLPSESVIPILTSFRGRFATSTASQVEDFGLQAILEKVNSLNTLLFSGPFWNISKICQNFLTISQSSPQKKTI